MIYKRLGRTGLELSRLGFGAMRLPEKQPGKPDPEEAVRIIHRAFELGVNYIDTAVMYCASQSQAIVGQALKGWRDKVYVSTKNHYHGTDERAWWRNLEDSLRLIDVDYLDIYNIHGINWKTYESVVRGPKGILSWMQKAKDQGLIRHICCSFHDSAEALSKIAATGEFSAITLQYNLLYRDLEPILPELAERDVGVIVMGPVGGGRFGIESDPISQMIPNAKSTPEVALRFVLSNPNVTLAISGMSTMQHVEENCAVAARQEPLSDAEKTQIEDTLNRLKGLAQLYCTGCNYCMPCPHGVQIPQNFTAVNYERVYGLSETARGTYQHLTGKAAYCVACGACEPKCPQNIPIRVQLQDAAKRFDAAYGKVTVSLEPVRLTDEGISFRARLHNLSDVPAKAAVGLTAKNGCALEPAAIEAEFKKPFEERPKPFAMRSTDDAIRTLEITADIEDPTGKRNESFRFAVGPCYGTDNLDDLCSRADTLPALVIERDDQTLAGKDIAPRPFAVKAWAGYTPDAFLLHLRLKDNRAPLPDHAPEGADLPPWFVDLLLDPRNRASSLAPGMQDGMFLLRIGTADGKPNVRVPRGNLEPAQVNVAGVTTRDGAELRLELPWDLLFKPTNQDKSTLKPGRALGFDLFVFYGIEWMPTYRAGWSVVGNSVSDPRNTVLFLTRA